MNSGIYTTLIESGQALCLPSVTYFDVTSLNGRLYRVFIRLPLCLQIGQKLNALVLLDGNHSIQLAAARMRNIESRAQITGAEPCLLIGVGYVNDDGYCPQSRARDYLPALPNEFSLSEFESGEADRFLNFLENELLPAVKQRFQIDFNRLGLYGHSYGGLFTLFALHKKPSLFSDYFAISPSVWWAEGWLVEKLKQTSLANISAGVLVAVGSLEKPLPSDDKTRFEKLLHRNMIGRAQEVAQVLQRKSHGGFMCDYKLIADMDHGTVVFPAICHSLQRMTQQEIYA